nr:MAG: hypothetical protein [Sesarmops intermedium nimavirus]
MIPYFKKRLEDGALKYEQDWDAAIKHDEESLSGLRKAFDLVLNLQPLKMIHFQDDSLLSWGEVESYDVVWVMEKWECLLFRYNGRLIKFGRVWCFRYIENTILDPCIIIQRWWKNILCRRRARVTILRWWRKILYQPDYFFKTSMSSKAKRNFDTSLKKTRTMDIAKAPAEAEEKRHQEPSPAPPPPPPPSASGALKRGASREQQQQIAATISAEKTPVCESSCSPTRSPPPKRRRCDTVDSPK